MVFCISTQFFHPNWDADIDYDAIILPSKTVLLLISSPYDMMFSYEPLQVFQLSELDYNLLKNSLDGNFGMFDIVPSKILETAFGKNYPQNILNDTCKNRGEYIRAGQSYFDQNPIRELLLDTINNKDLLTEFDRNYLINWLNQ